MWGLYNRKMGENYHVVPLDIVKFSSGEQERWNVQRNCSYGRSWNSEDTDRHYSVNTIAYSVQCDETVLRWKVISNSDLDCYILSFRKEMKTLRRDIVMIVVIISVGVQRAM